MGKVGVCEAAGTGCEVLDRKSFNLGFTGWGLRVGERWVDTGYLPEKLAYLSSAYPQKNLRLIILLSMAAKRRN